MEINNKEFINCMAENGQKTKKSCKEYLQGIPGSCIRYLLCPDGGRGDSQVCEGAESGNKDNAAKACKEPTDRGHMHRPGTQADQGYIQ